MMNNNFLAKRIRKFFEQYNVLSPNDDADNFEVCVVNTLDDNDKDGIDIMIDYDIGARKPSTLVLG